MKKLLCFVLLLLCVFPAPHATAENVSLDPDRKYHFQATGLAVHIPTVDRFRCLQGGGTDGTYAYYAMTNAVDTAIIHKYDLKTWSHTAASEPLKLGHANDITYDAEHHRLIVAHIDMQRVCYVDPDTLTDIGFDRTLSSIHRLSYLPETNRLLMATGYILTIYPNGNYKRADDYFICQSSRFTTQGLTSDDRYVYDVRWDYQTYAAGDKDAVCDYIVIHTLDGQYIGEIPVYGLEGEPENIIYLGGYDFVIGCNGSNNVYFVTLIQDDIE